MLSYRHAFHAGNHADVLKHVVLLEVLKYVGQKEAAVFYIDTHAGAGIYALDKKEAQKNKEYESGIGRLWNRNDLPNQLDDYISFIQRMNSDGVLRYYPGSPYFAEKVLRQQDRLRLFELHSTENRILSDNFALFLKQTLSDRSEKKTRGKRVIIEKKDGFSALKGLLPPPSKRAIVLMDPSYENKQDYQYVLSTLEDALKRFAHGIYLIWYPVINRTEAKRFPDKLKNLAEKEWLDVSLTVSQASPTGFGLHGSGLFIINPPWKLADYLNQLMPSLRSLLAQDDKATYRVTTNS